MNVVSILRSLDSVISMVKPAADIVGMGGIVKLVDGAIDIATNVLDNVKNTQEVISSEDETYIRGMLARLQADNDILMQKIKDA